MISNPPISTKQPHTLTLIVQSNRFLYILTKWRAIHATWLHKQLPAALYRAAGTIHASISVSSRLESVQNSTLMAPAFSRLLPCHADPAQDVGKEILPGEAGNRLLGHQGDLRQDLAICLDGQRPQALPLRHRRLHVGLQLHCPGDRLAEALIDEQLLLPGRHRLYRPGLTQNHRNRSQCLPLLHRHQGIVGKAVIQQRLGRLEPVR